MVDEEIGRFASVLEGCERIRAMMARDETSLAHHGTPARRAGLFPHRAPVHPTS
jgi:hypothetical protein